MKGGFPFEEASLAEQLIQCKRCGGSSGQYQSFDGKNGWFPLTRIPTKRLESASISDAEACAALAEPAVAMRISQSLLTCEVP